jgi:hypothetical protein
MPGIQMNIGDHVSPHPGFVAVPSINRDMVNWARQRAKRIANEIPSADIYFSTLPGGRTLKSLLNDSAIWINYDPAMGDYGATSVAHPNETALGPRAFRIGRWTVLATLIHELAHVNGAPGGNDHRAEQALVNCGLGRSIELTTGVDDPKTPYDPNISG